MNIESILKDINQSIEITNISELSEKINNFIISYKKGEKNIIFVTDFDFTLTKRYNDNNQELFSSYRFYDESLIGGDQNRILKLQNDLCSEYMKYEMDTSIDIKIREQKVCEFYTKSLDVYINPKFTRESIGRMLEKFKDKFELRKYTKELFELLIKLDIPIVIVSGGVEYVIIDLLKKCIKDFELYCQEKKIIIIANKLYFEEGKGCIGHSSDVIYAFNKSHFVGDIMKENFPNLENILILGDHLNDYDSVEDLNLKKNNIIGFGFINIKPNFIGNEEKKEEINNKIQEFKKVYDVNLIGDSDFQLLLKILDLFQNKNK